MHGDKTGVTKKTYGYLVAIEHDHPIPADLVAQAIAFYFDDDNNYKTFGTASIDVESLGEIDCYEPPTPTNVQNHQRHGEEVI